MAKSSYYANNLNRNLNENDGLPVISQDLESVRAYQWEMTFFPPAEVEIPLGFSKPLTLAAKRVNGMRVQVEDIAVNRVNDVTYYPGRPSMGELEVTFDNLLATKAGFQLYKYFQSVYDPLTGEVGATFLADPGKYKTNAEVLELNGAMEPISMVKLVGLYPKRFTKAEKNYSTNEFDTITVTFRYDFIIQLGDAQ
tara:strand:+ start:3782 stop:4369 length:588 start_codon:yes stop_codon:yes gene_type:complete